MVVVDGGRTLVFTYGTLKQGFSNHGLIQDMINCGEAYYVGVYRTLQRYPLVCGPYRVPFLLNFPGDGERVWGELYSVSERALSRMDELEGTGRGHYVRLPMVVCSSEKLMNDEENQEIVEAHAYFAHESYADGLWRRNGEKSICVYSQKEARNYVKRKDRPQNITFLEQINMFVTSEIWA